ncbi:MAG: PqqD family protein [Candidatus Omnitrophota bacterium]
MENRYPVRNPDVVAREEECEALLFNPADGNMMCINVTGIFIWDLLDGSVSIDEITGRIVEDFDTPPGAARADCRSFLKDLEEAGFIGYKI